MVVSSPTQAVGAGISQGTRGQPNSPWIRNWPPWIGRSTAP